MSEEHPNHSLSMQEIFEKTRKHLGSMRRTVSEPGKSCGACQKEGDLFLLPLRYGVVGKQDDIPALPLLSTSHNKVETISLQTAHYTIQMMREGYLYVLESRSGELNWRGFTVSREGCLHESALNQLPPSPPTFSCDITTHGVMASYINIQNSAELDAIYMLFSPDRMTTARLDDYQNNPQELQKILPEQWVSGRGGSAEHELDVIKPARLPQHVLEFHLAKKALERPLKPPYFSPDIGEMAVRALTDKVVKYRDDESFNIPYSEQLYSVPQLSQTAKRYPELIRGLEERNGLGIVLTDAIGITQSLTNWRNAAVQDELKPWMEAEDGHGISNERRMMVYQKVADIKDKFGDIKIATLLSNNLKRRIESTQKRYIGGGVFMSDEDHMSEDAWLAYLDFTEHDEKRKLEEKYTQARIAAEKTAFQEKYWNKIEANLNAFKRAFDAKCQQAETKAEARAKDVAQWLGHLKLVKALRGYDPADMTSGIQFSAQTGLCFIGLETSEVCRQLMDFWWQDTAMKERNLCWRSCLYNNAEALNEARTLAALCQQHTSLTLPFTSAQLSAFNNLYRFLDRALEHADKLADNQRVLAEKSAGILTWFGAVMRYTLKANLPNFMDKRMLYLLNGMAQYGIDKITFDLKLEEVGKRAAGRAYASRSAVKSNIKAAGEAELSRGKQGQFYRLRQAMNRTLIQSILLFMKGQEAREKGEERRYLEFVSAGIALAVVSIELVASSMEMVMARTAPSAQAEARGQQHGSITHRSAATYHSKLKVWAGVFNTVAGVMLVGYDIADADKAFQKKERALGFAYMGRGIAITLLTSGEIMHSLVAGQLYFQYLVKHAKDGLIRSAASLALNISSSLIAAQTGTAAAGLMLRGCVALMRFVPILGWATLAASVLFMVFGPDELEEWLDDCSFSNEKSRQKRITNTAEELARLEAAVNKVMA